MGLFDKKELDTKQDLAVNGAQLGGGIAGAGLGFLAGKALNGRSEQELLEEAKQVTSDKEIAERNWRILLDLKKGNIQLSDLDFGERDFFAKQLEENAEDLDFMIKNPAEEKAALQELGRGKVVPLFGEETPKPPLFQRGPGAVDLTPPNVVPLFENEARLLFPHKLQNPRSRALPALLGLAGAAAAGGLATKHYMKANEEKHKEEELKKFKEMLALATSSAE